MKKINIKKCLITILIITIIVLTIGFITITVKYTSNAKKEIKYNIEFTKIKKISSSKGSSKEPLSKIEITKNGKILDMSFNLYSPKDEIVYEITLKNTGTVSAEITELLMSPNYVEDNKSFIYPIKMSLTDISGKDLEPGEDAVVKIKLLYDTTDKIEAKTIKGKLGIITSND